MAAMPDVKVKVVPVVPSLKDYLAYRRAELDWEATQIKQAPPVSVMGGLIARGERLRIIEVLLAELDKAVAWLDAGCVAFDPPLTEADLIHWRWVRDHGYDVPDHILAML
jgi:hypothetical protein